MYEVIKEVKRLTKLAATTNSKLDDIRLNFGEISGWSSQGCS